MKKQKKGMKKVLSVLLALAMVITSISYTPKVVSAAEDYSTIAEWKELTNSAVAPESLQGSTYAVYSGTLNPTVSLFQGAGNNEIYFALGGKFPQSASLNGSSVRVATDQIFIENATDVLTYQYNVLTVNFSDEKVTVIIQCPNLTGTYEESGEPDPKPQTGNIAEGKQWTAWSNVAQNWDNVGESADGFTISEQKGNIGSQWWHIQTTIADIAFTGGTSYTCEFTLTAPSPKEFTVDGNSDNDKPFTEQEGGAWSNNGNETFSYKYVGTYEPAGDETKTIRISLGYHNNKDGKTDSASYATDQSYTFTVSGFKIVNSEEYVPSEPETKSSTTVKALIAPTDVALYDYRETADGNYKITFTDNDEDMTVADGDAKQFEVYVNGNAEPIATVDKSGDSIDASVIDNLNLLKNTQYTVTVKEKLERKNGEGTQETLTSDASKENYLVYSNTTELENGIAQVFVNTSRDDSTKDYDLYKSGIKQDVAASLVVRTKDGAQTWQGEGEIKLRGNSTAGGQKKPFNIKFKKKQEQNLFGFGAARKWSLLANTFDKSLIRNQIGIQFHNYVEETYQTHQFTSQCEPIDLYVDGNYMGSYLLLESVEAGTSRVDIDAENKDNHEILLELDSSKRDIGTDAHLDQDLELSTYSFTINEPEGDPSKPDEIAQYNQDYAQKKEWVFDYLTKFEQEISKEADSSFDEISKMIDVDSFVNYYITAELFKITDIDYSSTRFYIKNVEGQDKLYAGPLWDLDLSSGNNADPTEEGLHAQDMKWFGWLMKNPEFKKKVTARYEELLPQIKQLYAEGGTIDTLVATLTKSAEANYNKAYNAYEGVNGDNGYGQGWKVNYMYNNSGEAGPTVGGVSGSKQMYDNWTAYTDEFKTWMSKRSEYLMDQFGASDKDEELEPTDYENMVENRFYNPALGKDLFVSSERSANSQKQRATDGQFGNQDGTVLQLGEDADKKIWVTVDLGAYYKASELDEVYVAYKNDIAGANIGVLDGQPYTIEVSKDNENWETVVTRTITAEDGYDDKTHYATIDKINDNSVVQPASLEPDKADMYVRYVKVSYTSLGNWGKHISEIAVLDTDKNAVPSAGEDVPVPTFTAEAGDDNTIIVNITEAGDAQPGTTYVIYVDGKPYQTVDSAAEPITLTGLDRGSYQITVAAVHDGYYSEKAEAVTVEVTGEVSIGKMVNDPLYNMALSKDLTLSYDRVGEGNKANLNDGNISSPNTSYAAIVGAAEGYGNNNPGYVIVDLGNYYDASMIDKIMVQYRNEQTDTGVLTRAYSIQYSTNKEDWYTAVKEKTVSEYTASPENSTIDEVSAVEGAVRYIKIDYPKVADYGMQISEVAVFDTDQNAELIEEIVIAAPTLTAEGGYGKVTGTITAPDTDHEYTYTVYVDGIVFKSGLPEGPFELEAVEEGEHQITVRASYNKFYSPASNEQTVEVTSNVTYNNAGKEDNPETRTDAFEAQKDDLYNYVTYEKATASDPSGASNKDAKGAIDGVVGNSENNYWVSQYNADPQYLIIDLGNPYDIKEIAMIWEYRNAKEFKIQVSTDNDYYIDVAHVQNGSSTDNRYDQFTFTEPVNARYVKIYGISRSASWGYFLKEMAIYGPDPEVGKTIYTPLEEADYPKVDNAAWQQVPGTTDYWYYTPEANTIISWANNETGVIQPALSTDLFEAKIGDVALEKGNGTYMKMLESAFTQNGIYQVDLNNWQNSGTSRKFYIRKGDLPSYAVTGVTVTAITEDSATFNWTPSEDAQAKGYTYQIFVDGAQVGKDIDAGIGTYAWNGDLSDQKPHTLVIKTVDAEGNVVAESSEETFGYGIEPDLAVTNIELSVQDEDYSEGKTLTVTATFKNISAVDFPLPQNRLVVKPSYGGGQLLTGTNKDYMVVTDEHAECFNDDKSAFLAGASFTYTYTIKLTPEMLTGSYTIGARVENENNVPVDYSPGSNDFKEVVIAPATLPAIENFRARLSGNGDVIVGWTKATDEDEKNYTYEIYVDGDLQEGIETGSSEAGDRITATLQDLDEGRHQIEVRRTLDDEFSPKVHTYIIVYDASKLNWTQWEDRTQDVDNDTWWYAAGYMDAKEILLGAYGSGLTTDGEYLHLVLKENGEPANPSLDPATEVTVRGETYTITTNEGDLAYRQGDNIYLSHELFPIPNNVKERIFPITVTGKRSGVDVIKTFLVKLANADYATAKLEYVDADGEASEEPNGHVVFTWNDPDGHGTYGYKIHYYQYTDKYNPNDLKNPDETVESVKWVHPSDYIKNEDGSFSYHLTENEIYPRSNTEIKVVPVITRDGDEFEEEVGMATAQAELTFYGDPTTERGAYVSQTDRSTLIFKVINIGTAAVSTKALHEGANVLQIKVSEYTDASRTELVKTSGDHANPNTFNHNLDWDDVLPGEIITAEHEHLFKTRDTYYFTAEIDPNNYIYEFDADKNNVHDYDIRARYRGNLKIEWDEESSSYVAYFQPDVSQWGAGTPGMGEGVSAFEFSYYDHGELKTCRIDNTGISALPEHVWGDHVYKVTLPKDGENAVTHIDSDTIVTIATVGMDGRTVAVFADDTPFWQETEMDWMPITPENSEEPYDFVLSGTNANIEYKVLYAGSYYDKYHYRNIITKNNPYDNIYNRVFIADSNFVGTKDGDYFTTTMEFAQVSEDYCDNYGTSAFEPDYQYRGVRSGATKVSDENIIPAESISPFWWDGSGFQMDVRDFGFGKYYAMRIKGAVEGQELILAVRVLTEEGEGWIPINPTEVNQTTVHDFFYHNTNNQIKDARYYYDASDFYLSSIGGYNGTYIKIITDTNRKLNEGITDGHQNWKVMIAPTKVDARGKVIEPKNSDDYKTYWGGSGIAGKEGNDINFGMLEAIREFPGHSGKSGLQNFYYYIRVYTDTEHTPNEYISAPIRVRADVPEIEPLPEENINVSSGSKNLYVSFTETKTGGEKDYVYDIYLDGELVSSLTDLKDGRRVSVPVPETRWEDLNQPNEIFKIKIVSKWCYSAEQSDTTHWYADGSGDPVNHYQQTETTYTYENEIETGEVYVQGFQMNTNKEEGGISEFMPSMRVVSKAAERIMHGSRAYGVVSYGTIIAPSSGGAELNKLSWNTQQDIEKASGDGSLAVVEASTSLKWTGADANMYNYYGVSLKNLLYKYSELETKYQFRAYAVLDDDDSTVVLSENTYEVDLNEVAKNLYDNHQMGTKEGHEFLYDDILNIVAIHNNYMSIAQAMLKTLDIKSSADDNYKLINKVYKDLYYYTEGSSGYTYQNRIETAEDGTVTKFVSKHLTDEESTGLLEKLNEVSDANNGEVGKQATLYDWIEANVGTLKSDTKDLTKYQGFYQTLDYQWDDNLYKVGSPVSGNSE